jgi:hypothetical protein
VARLNLRNTQAGLFKSSDYKMDWTERRPHIGGAVGAALASRCVTLKWIKRVRDSRALTITPAGRRALTEIALAV